MNKLIKTLKETKDYKEADAVKEISYILLDTYRDYMVKHNIFEDYDISIKITMKKNKLEELKKELECINNMFLIEEDENHE